MLSIPVPMFRLEVRPQRSNVVVEPDGEIDCATAPRVAAAVDELLRAGWEAIVVELGAVSFIDSAGLMMFLSIDARAREAGARLELRGPCAALDRLVSMTGLEQRFTRS